MRWASTKAAALLNESQIVLTTRVDSWLGTELLAAVIPIEDDGVISEDSEALLGGTLRLTVPADDVWSPDSDRARHPLGDQGQRLHVTRYVAAGDGTQEPIVMGWYRIEESPVEDGVVRVQAAELWCEPQAYEPPAPIVTTSTSTWEALRDVLADTIPQPSTLPAGLGDRDPGVKVWDEDRLAAVAELVDSLGATARVDPCGIVDLTPDPSTEVVRVFADGVAGTVVDRTPAVGDLAPNAFVARSVPDGDGPPIQAIVVVEDGPQRWGGPYGRRPQTHESPLYTSYAECLSGATRLLARARARQWTWKVSCAPDPRLRIDDLVAVDWTESDESVRRVLLRVRSIEHPLSPAAMTFTADEAVI